MPPPRSTSFMPWLRPLLLIALLQPAAGCAPRTESTAWVVRYDIDSPAKVDQVCAAAKAASFDFLLLQVRGRADAYYQSAVAPPGETLHKAPAGFDPLAAALTSCAPASIHAWLNVYYIWSGDPLPADPRHPANPGIGKAWILRDADGRPVSDYTVLDRAVGWIEGIYADPASEEYRRLMVSAVRELLQKYPLKGIHLDFVRYPGPAYGQAGPLGELFRDRWGIDPRLLPLHLSPQALGDWLAGTLPPAESTLTTAALFWAELRASQVTALVRDIRKTVDQHGSWGTELSAAVFPDAADAYLAKGQDWQTWSAVKLVDALYPMAYFGETERVEAQLMRVALGQESGSPVKRWAGLGAYIKGPGQIAGEAAFARRSGYHGIALFSLGHLLRKPEGLAPYAEAIAGQRVFPVDQTESSAFSHALNLPRDSPMPEVTTLSRIVAKAHGGKLPPYPPEELEKILRGKLAELTAARDHHFAAALAKLRQAPVTPPAWVELHGIFRYAHALDPQAIWLKQQQEAFLARQRLLAGDDIALIAREFSQGGSKNLGGELGRRYLDPATPGDALLARLKVGDLSPVLETENGFWVYRLDARGQDARAPWDALPWEARRILFRDALRERMR